MAGPHSLKALFDKPLILRRATPAEARKHGVTDDYLVLIDSTTGEVAAQIREDDLFDNAGNYFLRDA